MTWDEEVFDLEGMKNVKWVKSTNYKVDGKSLFVYQKIYYAYLHYLHDINI